MYYLIQLLLLFIRPLYIVPNPNGAGGTGTARYGNKVERQQWVLESMINKAATSLFSNFIGSSRESNIIVQKNDLNAKGRQIVNYNFRGPLVTTGYRDKEEAYGKGKAKTIFSDMLQCEYGIYTVDNGWKIDAQTLGITALSEHSDSMSLLADLWVRARDQMFIDTMNGYLDLEDKPTHFYRSQSDISSLTSTDKLSYNMLLDIELALKTGNGFRNAAGTVEKRYPIQPATVRGGQKRWVMLLDSYQVKDLLDDANFRSIYRNAQVRGTGNELINHTIAELGLLSIIEMPECFGTAESNKRFKQGVEQPGLRLVDKNGKFSATALNGPTTLATGPVASRGLILGVNAVGYSLGQAPDYLYQKSPDFGRSSESALEVVLGTKLTKYTAEVEDYADVKRAGYTLNCIPIDTFNSTYST